MNPDAPIPPLENDSHLQSDPHACRHEYSQDGELLGFIDYYLFERTAIAVHTEVFTQGKGHGSLLAAEALEAFRERQYRVAPVCGFLAAYMRKHPEYADLTTPESRRIFDL